MITVVTKPSFSMRTLMRARLAPLLRVGDGGVQPGAREREIAVAQGVARVLDVALRLRRERGLGLRELIVDGRIAAGEERLRLLQRAHAGLQCLTARRLLLLGSLPARLGVGH